VASPINYLPQDRLVAKEVALGVIREYAPPQDHIVLPLLAPFKNVESDDAVFSYTRGMTAGLAPARAEDAESELAQKDDSIGMGRASIIDWALKDHYDPSDVSRYREALVISDNNMAPQLTSLPLTITNILDGFTDKIARDTAIRRRKIDNRIEWLGTQALWTNGVTYNDGKILFTVTFGRPSANILTAPPSTFYWDNAAQGDPIGDVLALKDFMFNTKGVDLAKCIISRRMVHALLNNTKFTNSLIGSNPLYTVRGWGYQAALDTIAAATNMDFVVYDSVYRTRAIGANTMTNNRFTDPRVALFLPSDADLASLDDAIGFGATLTSPHPEGNWTPGYYEWEQETVDPWGRDVGTGIKAFPVFPHLDLTVTCQVLSNAFVDPITGTSPGMTFTLPPY
jgi:Phage major capsid protein E